MPSRAIKVFLTPERAELQRRIETRFAAMLAAGALEEVRALAARGLDPGASGHEGAWGALADPPPRGRDHACRMRRAAAWRDTWRYTKRQATWFRNRMPGWSWIAPEAAQALILREISQISA